MTQEDFVEILNFILDTVSQKEAKFYLVNMQSLFFPIDPDFQKWMAEVYTPHLLSSKLKKYAIVIPDDFVTQLSTHQTEEEVRVHNPRTNFRLFRTEAEARQWFGIDS
jgi:hypothetical protein